MVKENPDSDGNFAPSVLLTTDDRDKIHEVLSDTTVEGAESKVRVEDGEDKLNIDIRAKSQSDLNDQQVYNKLKDVAEKIGFNSNKMNKGKFPTQEEPRTYNNIDEIYYKIPIKFTYESATHE